MGRRTLPIILLAILGALVVVAINSSGQTPPPTSGEWEIYDDTYFSNTTIDLPENIYVYYGGSLTLENVDLKFLSAGFPYLNVESGGKLDVDGGVWDYLINPPRYYLTSNCSINAVDFTGIYFFQIADLGVSITNCTFKDTTVTTLRITTTASVSGSGPIVIDDNTFTNCRNPIYATLGDLPGVDVRVEVRGNHIDGVADSDGIYLESVSEKASIIIKDNELTNVGGTAINLNLWVPDLYLRLDGNRVNRAGKDGICLQMDSQVLDFPGIVELNITNVGQYGFRMVSLVDPVPDLALASVTVTDAAEAAIGLTNVNNVTMLLCYIDVPSTDLVLEHSTVGIYQTLHERGSAQVSDEDSSVTSWRELDMTCLWRGGIPVSGQRVDVRDPVIPPLLTAFTGPDGHWGNHLYADWYLDSDGLRIIDTLTPVVVHSSGNVTADPLPADRDQVVTVTFNDTILPVIRVTHPSGDLVQNVTDLQINGTCFDAHSGVALVQYSFDPNPDWDEKVWTNARGTNRWTVDRLYISQGEYTLFVRAFDRSGLTDGTYASLEAAVVVVDLTPPHLAVTSPDLGRQPVVVQGATLTIQGWVDEPVSRIWSQRVEVPVEGTAFTLDISLHEGLNNVVVYAADLAGNVGHITFTVLRDSGAPTITLTAPVSGALINTTSVLVAGLLDEPVQGNRVVINGVPATLSSGTFELLLSGLTDGTHTIDVEAFDLAGNPAKVAVDVIVDTLPPVLKLVSPSDGSLTGQANILVEGTSEAGAVITVQGRPVSSTGTTFSQAVQLVEGRNVITVTATDAVGNVNSTFAVVDLDTVAPQITVHGMENGTLVTTYDNVDLTGITEPGARMVLVIGGVETQVRVYDDGSFYHGLPVEELETLATLRAEDAAGNMNQVDVLVVRKETVAPPAPTPEGPVDPVVTAAVVTATTAVIIGVAMTFEFTKYALVLMVVPLYARIKKHEVLDNKTRLAIHGLVVENPGMHYNEIIREFDLTNGVAAYHLDVLEREGFVRSVRDGTLRRFYSTSTKVPSDSKATPDEMRERILELVTQNPGINQKSIVDELGIGRTLVGYHLKTLIDEGYVEAHKQGRFTIYSRTRKRWFRLN